MATIDDDLAKSVTEGFRQAQIDIVNQDLILSGTGDVTVTLADGSKKTGPSWSKLITAANAAGTSTINDASLPGVGSTVNGGYLKSQYTVNGVEKMYAQFQVVKRIEWNYAIARLTVMQAACGTDTAQNNYFDFMSNGNVQFGGKLVVGAPAVNSWWNAAQPHYSAYYAPMATDTTGIGVIGGLSWGYRHSEGYDLQSMWGNVGNGLGSWANTALTQFGDFGGKIRYWYFTPANGDLVTSASGDGGFAGNYTYQKSATSDATLKHDITYDDGQASYENIRKLKPCTFVYNGDYLERVRRGIIAQDALRDIDSEYVKLVPAAPEFDEEGNRCDKDDTLALDNNVIQMDTALALHHAIAKIETLTKQVAQLQAEVQALKA